MKGSVLLDKQRGTWYFSFDRKKDTFTGKRQQVKRRGFSSKQEAYEAMVKLQAEMLNEQFIDLSTMKYDTYIDEWMKERSFHLQKSTFDIHQMYIENVIKPRIGHFRLQKIQPIHMQSFVNDLVVNTDYSAHTVHIIFRIISASLKKAQVLKLIKENPTIGITLPKIKKSEMNIWTSEQVNHFISEGKNVYRPTRFYVACVIALLTGMRQGEIMGLRWKDIDFENRIIYIRQTLTQTGEIKVGAKNNASIRNIHFPIKLIGELELHRETIKKEREYYGRDYENNDLVICTRKGNPLIPRNGRIEFYNLTEKLGLPKIRFHDLRHTHATMLIQQNVNVKLISERLGHTDIQTTLNTYSHVLPTMQREVADKLDQMFG
ncbi:MULTISPECIES: site-specific integrase [Bacillus]|uniref:site-specific integrase n=1 Tax=Bacillus TaxID=1386 RepID=UPI000B5DAA77|nr:MULTISPECIES: site-specific integrase [Bacillus]OXB99475.1 site-specific integrase [Bacillus sp. M13(2017)]QCY61391.1 site-specific integrase [Bacillus thuringiensis]